MIVVDASFVMALRDPTDAHHEAATRESAAMGDERAVLPAVTFAECLLAPAKLGVLDDVAGSLRAAYDVVDADTDAPLRWASLRAETGLRLPDAIVLDAALGQGARAVATFDDKLAARSVDRKLEVLGAQLDGTSDSRSAPATTTGPGLR